MTEIRCLSQTELKPNVLSWITLVSNIEVCDEILERFDHIEGMMDEIGLKFCDMDERGVDITPHCAASSIFEQEMRGLRSEVWELQESLVLERDKRQEHGTTYRNW